MSEKSWLYEKFLRRDGRLNRMTFFKRSLLTTLIEVLILLLLIILTAIFLPDESYDKYAIPIMMIAILFVTIYLNYGLIIRRCHDLSRNSVFHQYILKDDACIAKFIFALYAISTFWTVFDINLTEFDFYETPLNFVDILSLIAYIYLIFAPGEIGTNRHGAEYN